MKTQGSTGSRGARLIQASWPCRLTDREILLTGDAAGFAVFYDRHAEWVLAFARRRSPDAESAADVTAEVFAAALAARRRYSSQSSSAHAWLLAIASNDRMVSSPHVPTFREQGIEGIHIMGWFSAMVPAATPRPIVDQLSKWLNEIVSMEDTRKCLISMGSDPWVSSPEIAQKQLAADIENMGRLVKAARIVPQ